MSDSTPEAGDRSRPQPSLGEASASIQAAWAGFVSVAGVGVAPEATAGVWLSPALSPEEWTRYTGKGDEALWRVAQQMIRQGRAHAAAALLLQVEESDGGPLFTWEGVAALRRQAQWCEEVWHNVGDGETLASLANRIAALLPPRETP